VRFRTDLDTQPVCVRDELQGDFCQDVSSEVGDFVIRRRDGFFAYQLAVVVDDGAQGITEVVRGCDLLDNTPRQVQLQRALSLPTPRYAHLPLVVEPGGHKLAKSRRSVPLAPLRAAPQLVAALTLLGQAPPAALATASVREVWGWAFAHWRPAVLAGRREVEAPAG
jgi:glutamyl-Q tRNA(Asp) synthetase